MTGLSLKSVCKKFGDLNVIQNIDLTIEPNEFVVFVGPSGCGKSTLLRMIAGLEEISSGEFWIGNKRADHLPVSDRDIAMVFQSYALYPHMTLGENIGFPLRLAKMPKQEIQQKVSKISDVLHLTKILDRKPGQISGGQRQRVAIGRALARDPKVILLDEPLSNLDAALRLEMRVELARLHKQLDATMIYVTHDQVEAMTLADRIVILNNGQIAQVGTPLDLYNKPANTFVAEFIGSPKMNIFPATIETSATDIPKINLTNERNDFAFEASINISGPIQMGIRPEHMVPVNEGGIRGLVNRTEHLGSDTYVYFQTENKANAVARLNGIAPIQAGENISFTTIPEHYHLFDQKGIRIE
ncbi:ABC transporter ATP-binding protein [Kiloniella antarctica]|uniref:ABC transporter ATP-binding protein n=1 Tax=Kiloniella antarctica TaxID=1550907 RepID=A0ABW5BNX6_9PROT